MDIHRRADLLAYVPLAAATTIGAVTGRDRTHIVSKVLLAPTLAAGVAATAGERSRGRTATLVAALAGSTAGDWLMYRSSQAGRAGDEGARRAGMRRGASAFAVQQAGMIELLLRDGARPTRASVGAVALWLASLAVVEGSAPGEGSSVAPDPVLAGYGVLLGSMAGLAVERARTRDDSTGIGLGGVLFVISDTAIVVADRFVRSDRARQVSDAVVLSTYTAALALLVHGLRREA